MMHAEVRSVVDQVIGRLAHERGLSLPELREGMAIVDELGFSSMMVAGLIAHLEEVFGIDPFQDENVMITDIRTIGDLCDVYARCVRA